MDTNATSSPARPERPAHVLSDVERNFLAPLLQERERTLACIETALNLIHRQAGLKGAYGLSSDGSQLVPKEA